MSELPSFEQLSELPTVSGLVVGPEHLDVNGHMNIRHYFMLGSTALWQRSLDDLGMPASYITDRGLTTFTAEQHLRYFGECTEGDRLAAGVVVVDRGDKSLHLAAVLTNHTRRELSCVMEALLVHVDFATRRPVSWPDDVAALLDDRRTGDRLGWTVPLSGGLGVRR